MDRCFNCQKKAILQDSHIIPEFLYKYVYTNDHKFTKISPDNNEHIEIFQKGFREKLLCHNCEELLSKEERITAKFFIELTSGKFLAMRNAFSNDNLMVLTDYNYTSIKKCLLSILWRASISSLDLFANYNLGPYNKIIQDLIFSENNISWDSFPIMITKVKIANKFISGLICSHKRGRYKNISIYSITLASFNIDYFITKDFQDKEYKKIFLNEENCAILDMSINELKITPELLNRFNDKDVKDFYEKHS